MKLKQLMLNLKLQNVRIPRAVIASDRVACLFAGQRSKETVALTAPNFDSKPCNEEIATSFAFAKCNQVKNTL